MMDFLTHLLSVDNIAVQLLGSPLSHVELAGTITYLLSVWLVSRRHILTWPIGIASSFLYLCLFYQIRLYADAMEQIYFIVASLYGWWSWRAILAAGSEQLRVTYSKPPVLIRTAVFTLVLTWMLAEILRHLHLWVPVVFPAPADMPYLDSMTTVMSFTAMWLMAARRTESWIYWIVVDVIGIGLYYAKDVKMLTALYAVLLVLAVRGFREWDRASK